MEQANVDTPSFLSTLAWAEKNKKQLLYGAVALVLVGFVVAYLRWSSREQEAAAGREVADDPTAQTVAQSGTAAE